MIDTQPTHASRPPIEEITAVLKDATPAPWHADDYGLYVWSKSIPNMVASHSPKQPKDLPEGATKITDIRGWGELQYLGEEKAISKQKANARLIASAPQYLLDCLAYIEHLESQLTTTKGGKE